MTTRLALALAAALGLSAPLRASDTSPAKAPAAAVTSNPFFAASTLPYAAPPFDRIRDEHYLRNGINSTLDAESTRLLERYHTRLSVERSARR